MEEGVGDAWWHIHHNKLCELLSEPIENRVEWIRAQKPHHEIEIRLALMKPVVGPLPEVVEKVRAKYNKAAPEYDKAWDEYNKTRTEYDKVRAKPDKAWDEYHKAWDEYHKAWVKFDKVRAEYDKALNSPEMDALHELECPNCPWNGLTIFP